MVALSNLLSKVIDRMHIIVVQTFTTVKKDGMLKQFDVLNCQGFKILQ